MPAMFALGEGGDRQPGGRDVRRVRLVRDAAARRLRGPDARRGCRRRRRSRSRAAVFVCVGTLCSRRVAGRARHGARGVRRAVRRRRQLGPRRRHDRAAALVHPAGVAAGAGLLDPRPARRLGPRVGAPRCSRRAAVAGTRARPGAQRRDRGACSRDCVDGSRSAAERLAVDAGERAVEALHRAFFATPYRPTGLSTAARAVVRLVDELRWLDAIVVSAPQPERGRSTRRVPVGPPRRRCSSAARTCSTRRRRVPGRPARRPGRAERALDRARERRRCAIAGPEPTRSPRSTRASAPRSWASWSRRSPATSTSPRRPSGAPGSSSCWAASPPGCPVRSRPPRSARAPTSRASRCGCRTASAAPPPSGSRCSSPT